MTKNWVDTILKDSDYDLSLFSNSEIQKLEKSIIEKNSKPYINCIIREKEVQLKPEEIVRQFYALKLINEYGYPKKRIRFEHPVQFGRETKSADIVVFDKDRPTVEYIIVEVKKPKLKDSKEQLRSYCNATGSPIGVWTNGAQISHYNRKDPNFFEDITDIPKADQTLEDILKERFTWRNLIIKDKIPNEGKSLKTIITEMEDEVLANAGVDVFEELYEQLKQHQPQKGEILLSKDATPGIAFYSKDVPGKMIPSGGILRLTVKDSTKILPEYLTLVLDSILVQKQIERDTGGSIINHWLVDQVKLTLIPILPVTKQKEISEKVNDSFCNRTLAKRLLGIAKRGVELAIEENEQSAEKWIKRELDKLGVET